MVCPKCGALNPDGAIYCSLCQETFVQGQQPMQDSQSYNASPESVLAPSEWVGSSPPVTTTRPLHTGFSPRKIVTLVIVLAVMGGLAVVVAIVWPRHNARTYKSQVSGLAFQYPTSWKEVSTSEVVNMISKLSPEQSSTNENVIVDSTEEATFKNGIIPMSMAGVDNSSWAATVRDKLVAKFQSDPALAGEQISAVSIKCGPAVVCSGTKTVNNQTVRYRSVFVNHNNKMYYVTYLTIDPNVDIDSQWQKIEDSIGFTD